MAGNKKTQYELLMEISGKLDGSFSRSTQAAQKQMSGLSSTAKRVAAGVAAALAAVQIGAFFVDSTQKAMAFEETMSDVVKVVDGLRDANGKLTEAYYDTQQSLVELSTSLPQTTEELGQIMAAGGQSGIPLEDLTQFTETASKMAIAFDTTADQAGEWMAVWRSSLRLTQDEVAMLGDQLNYLGNTTSENALKLSEVVTRVGALAKTSGLAASEVATFAASMPGVSAEVSATAIKNMMLAMTAGSAATERQAATFEKLGFSAEQMAQRMQQDASGAILDLLGAMKQLPKAEQVSALSQLFGTEAAPYIAPLLENLSVLEQRLQQVGDANVYAGSMEAEFAARSDTTANKIKLAQNRIEAFQIRIGQMLLPVIGDTVEALYPLLDRLNDLGARYGPKVQAGIEMMSGAFQRMIPKVAPVLTKASSLLRGTWSAAQPIFEKLGAAGSWAFEKIGGAASVIYEKLGPVVSKVAEIFNGKLLPIINDALGRIGPPAAAALEALGALFGPLLSQLEKVPQLLDAAATAFGWLYEQAAPVLESLMRIASGILSLIGGLASMDWSMIASGISEIFLGAVEGILNLIRIPANTIIDTINNITGAFGGKLPDWIPIIGGKDLTIPEIPEFASGGIVTQPTLSMVGEGGEAEAILPLSRLSELLGEKDNPGPQPQDGGGEQSNFTLVFHFHGSTPDEEKAKEAASMAFAEFKRMYLQMKAEERRLKFG